jgi:hypothetical protein
MHIISFPQQVGWLGDKRIDFCPWGSRINLHEWHGLVKVGMLIEYSLLK